MGALSCNREDRFKGVWHNSYLLIVSVGRYRLVVSWIIAVRFKFVRRRFLVAVDIMTRAREKVRRRSLKSEFSVDRCVK